MFHPNGPRELSQRLIYVQLLGRISPASDCDIDKLDVYLQCGDYGTVAERSCERDIV